MYTDYVTLPEFVGLKDQDGSSLCEARSCLYYSLIILYLNTLFQIFYISLVKCLLWNALLRTRGTRISSVKRGPISIAQYVERYFAVYRPTEYCVCLEGCCTLCSGLDT